MVRTGYKLRLVRLGLLISDSMDLYTHTLIELGCYQILKRLNKRSGRLKGSCRDSSHLLIKSYLGAFKWCDSSHPTYLS